MLARKSGLSPRLSTVAVHHQDKIGTRVSSCAWTEFSAILCALLAQRQRSVHVPKSSVSVRRSNTARQALPARCRRPDHHRSSSWLTGSPLRSVVWLQTDMPEVFQQAGMAVLLYDHRNFGLSDGVPRQEINKWVQARGYRRRDRFRRWDPWH